MVLKIEVIKGEAQNICYSLHPITEIQPRAIILREDDVLALSIQLKQNYEKENLFLALHEQEIPCSEKHIKDNQYQYTWLPNRENEALFLNYYGIAEFDLIRKQNDEIEIIRQFHPIEILAKKINADRVEAMLNFLAEQNEEILADFFRVTRRKSGFQEKGARDDLFLIERLEKNIQFLDKTLPTIYVRPLTHWHEQTQFITPNENTLIDDSGLAWLATHTDQLYQVDSIEETTLHLDGTFYGAYQIPEVKFIPQTDIYENQVLHGFIALMIRDVSQIIKQLEEATYNNKLTEKPEYNGYRSFFSQKNLFLRDLNNNKIQRCKHLKCQLEVFSRQIQHKIPVSRIITKIIQITPKAKRYSYYFKIFQKMMDWQRYGSPDWSTQEELSSIRDMPKLFEYYALFLIKHYFDRSFTVDEISSSTKNYEGDIASFYYRWGDFMLKVEYEPKIYQTRYKEFHTHRLINSEQWKVSREGQISRRSGRGKYNYRSPDILISLEGIQGNIIYFVVDAKYKNNEKVFIYDLPELTLKYLHGIHEKETGKNLSCGLMLINPDTESYKQGQTRHYHRDEYNIYGNHPVIPAMMVSSIVVGSAHHAGSNLTRDLAQIIQFMKGNLVKNEVSMEKISFKAAI
ncbi:DUF2357 domain-containing protein [Candidatus Nitrosacidococcus sp. I8]|uniref:DUF2357 domain-containing protein n=1 Tax=Candidatus Nitrosacidococcus sp. I8 TaxID=2942908 RepID=UPI0022278943|nr:DUF2357 domain-containing protein [Candidatus Nitrosacidococcus sp. I8]CAH9018135.1 hypothetical protein NURINAE_00748 [Candidatus Nitrosacidococcus sp. I8]